MAWRDLAARAPHTVAAEIRRLFEAAFRDPADALHNRAVAAFRTYGSKELVMPASVYAEVLVAPLRVGAPAVASLEQFIGDFGMRIAPLTAEIARLAASLRAATPSLRLPDAFVLATGEALDAAIVLTADGAWPKVSARVRFRSQPPDGGESTLNTCADMVGQDHAWFLTDQSSGRAEKAFFVFKYHPIPDMGFFHRPCIIFRALSCVSSPLATTSFKCLSSAFMTSSAVFP